MAAIIFDEDALRLFWKVFFIYTKKMGRAELFSRAVDWHKVCMIHKIFISQESLPPSSTKISKQQ